jgi:hypothetical protein
MRCLSVLLSDFSHSRTGSLPDSVLKKTAFMRFN